MIIKQIDSNLSLKFAGVLSVIKDLEYSKKCSEKIKELMHIENNPDNDMINRALWESAIISFFRCFKSGIRTLKLNKEMFFDIPGETQEFFCYLENYRDKHIAHSFNYLSEIIIGVELDDDFNVIGLCNLDIRHHGENVDNLNTFILFIDIALKFCFDKLSKFHNDLLHTISKFDKEELKNLKDFEYKVPDILIAAKKFRKQG